MTPARTICLGFLAVIFAGTILLMMPFSTSDGSWSSPITALFTSTSAVCVTGLSVVDVGRFYSFWGQLVLVLLVQVGGLGYMTATTFLLVLIGRKFSLREKVALQQSLDIPGLQGSTQLVRSIIATTLLFELTGVFILIPVFSQRFDFAESLWQSIFHSVNAFNNAGFSLFTDNLIGYVHSPTMNWVISLLIVCGGIGYQVIIEAYLWGRSKVLRIRKPTHFSLNFKVSVSTTLLLLGIGTLGYLLIEFNNPDTFGSLSWGDKLMAAWFQSVTPRTAGFNTIDFGKVTVTGLVFTIALMFIGASPGGTGGGIKTTTLRLLASCTQSALQGKSEITLYDRLVPTGAILKAVGVAAGSLATVVCSLTLLSLTDPEFDFIHLLFEVTSAFGTVGLSAGITGKLSAMGQLVIIATMYIGRVGILLLMAALLGEPKPTAVQYPEETLLVG